MKHLVFLLVLLVAHSLAAQEEHKNYYEPDTIESGPSNSSSVNETPTKSRAKVCDHQLASCTYFDNNSNSMINSKL